MVTVLVVVMVVFVVEIPEKNEPLNLLLLLRTRNQNISMVAVGSLCTIYSEDFQVSSDQLQ